MGPPRFELEFLAPKAYFYSEKFRVSPDILEEFIGLRRIEGICEGWIDLTKYFLTNNLEELYWIIDKKKTIDYLNKIRKEYSVTFYRKMTYQIRRILTYLKIDWANNIKSPSEPIYILKYITEDNILDTLNYFKDIQYFIQIKSLILLGVSSGMRAEEMYQLTIDDINQDTRTVHVNHNPQNGQSTKTKYSRISFFNNEAKEALTGYLTYFKSDRQLKQLFSQSHITSFFRNAPIQVKDLRK